LRVRQRDQVQAVLPHNISTTGTCAMTIEAQYQERLRNFAKTCPSADKGVVTIAVCKTCGNLNWVCTDTKEQPGYVDEDMEPGRCGSCSLIAQRAPEIGMWVIAVVHEALRRDRAERNKETGLSGGTVK